MAEPKNTASGPCIVITHSNLPMVVPTSAQPPQAQPARLYHVVLKGQPKALGITQLMVAFLYISLGTVLLFTLESFVSISTYSGISYWGAALYIISGSLSIAAGEKQCVRLVKGALAMNVISSMTAMTAICLYCIDSASHVHNYNPPCIGLCNLYNHKVFRLREIALGFLIGASVLQLCISVSVSFFGCRFLDNHSSLPQVLVLANDYQSPVVAPVSLGNTAGLNYSFPGDGDFMMTAEAPTITETNAALKKQRNYNQQNNTVYPVLAKQQ
ncbi:membrane-spanning 4-domains subfamily A member 4A-like [Hyperolius riggenbachi]|uniref:membrane-spanning 4-domains subfamily A member 4A-like n=1 Tax=Hyperolius riggenbachi TaxID=752182 RepID=UPI0035A2EFD5